MQISLLVILNKNAFPFKNLLESKYIKHTLMYFLLNITIIQKYMIVEYCTILHHKHRIYYRTKLTNYLSKDITLTINVHSLE